MRDLTAAEEYSFVTNPDVVLVHVIAPKAVEEEVKPEEEVEAKRRRRPRARNSKPKSRKKRNELGAGPGRGSRRSEASRVSRPAAEA